MPAPDAQTLRDMWHQLDAYQVLGYIASWSYDAEPARWTINTGPCLLSLLSTNEVRMWLSGLATGAQGRHSIDPEAEIAVGDWVAYCPSDMRRDELTQKAAADSPLGNPWFDRLDKPRLVLEVIGDANGPTSYVVAEGTQWASYTVENTRLIAKGPYIPVTSKGTV